MKNGVNVRGISKNDCHKCYLVKDDSVVVGNDKEAWHFPCVIAMREGCKAIGKVNSNMRQERLEWFKNHNSFEDPICREDCLDVCQAFNRKVEYFQSK